MTGGLLLVISGLIGLITPSSSQTTGGCNIQHDFTAVGQTALLQSPGYPSSYPDNTDCRYTITSPQGTGMTISCGDFNVETTTNCAYDVLFLSLTGDASFRDQEFFCGKGSWSRTSKGNRLSIGFHSDQSNPQSTESYRFQCQITVIKQQSTQPQQPSCSCGESNVQMTRIVGGSDAGVAEFPWRVSLYSQTLGVFCGGTIISANYVLTAAHCTKSVQSGDTIYVNAGDHDISSTTEAQNQMVPVAYVVQNPYYNEDTQDSDMSLLKLQTPLTLNGNVRPVCLPWKYVNSNFNGVPVTASGWGTQYFGGAISPVLKKVEIPVMETDACAKVYVGTHITVTNNMLCTYAPGKDTCQGDSGGSADYRDTTTGRWYAIGVTSQGISCGQDNQPGVYSKITKFLNWIQSTTGENYCKI